MKRYIGMVMMLAVTAGATAAQERFPARPIRIVLPVAPGGGVDVIMRPVANRLSASLAQQIVLDHRGGAGGNIGHEIVAKAPADGYTLLVVTPTIATNVGLYPKLAYDPVRDFAPITQVSEQSYVLLTHPRLRAAGVREFMEAAKTKGAGGVTFGSAGAGSLNQLGMELLKARGKFDATHVPFKGAGPALIAVVSGEIDAMFSSLSAGAPLAKGGKLRAIGVTSAKRSSLLPDVAPIAEQGFPGFEVSGWYGLLAPAGTPPARIATLHGNLVKVLQLPDIIQGFEANGALAVGSTPGQFDAYLKSEIKKWTAVVRTAGVKAD